MSYQDHVLQACNSVGGKAKLARHLGVTPGAVQHWCSGVRPVPVRFCKEIASLAGGEVILQGLRPNDWQDIWPELVQTQTSVAGTSEVGHG